MMMMSWSHPADLLRQDRAMDGEKPGGGARNRLRHRHPAGQQTNTHTQTNKEPRQEAAQSFIK